MINPSPSGLPLVRGNLTKNAVLGKRLWLRAGGRAQYLFQPKDTKDLIDFLGSCSPTIQITVVGAGSNLLVRDGGVLGVVIRLGQVFATIEQVQDQVMRLGASALAPQVARACIDYACGGLEFLAGIPGTIGGCIRMNAGAHGSVIGDQVRRVTALTRHGELIEQEVTKKDFSYRHCHLPQDWVFLSADIACDRAKAKDIICNIERVRHYRSDHQPRGKPTGGSTFRNPPGQEAWRLINQAGCRGLRVGEAMVSEKHCNFLVNDGHASANDFEQLGEDIRRRVKQQTGIALEWEICRIGQPICSSEAIGS